MVKKIILRKQKSKGGLEYYQLLVKGKVAEQVLTMDNNLIIALLGEEKMDIEVDQSVEIGEFNIF